MSPGDTEDLSWVWPQGVLVLLLSAGPAVVVPAQDALGLGCFQVWDVCLGAAPDLSYSVFGPLQIWATLGLN